MKRRVYSQTKHLYMCGTSFRVSLLIIFIGDLITFISALKTFYIRWIQQ
jgi:hypothetical protein